MCVSQTKGLCSVFTGCSSHTCINHNYKSFMLQLKNKPQAADLSFTATIESQMHHCRYGAISLISIGKGKIKLHVGVKAVLLWLIYLANYWVLMTCLARFSRWNFLFCFFIPRMLKPSGNEQIWLHCFQGVQYNNKKYITCKLMACR